MILNKFFKFDDQYSIFVNAKQVVKLSFINELINFNEYFEFTIKASDSTSSSHKVYLKKNSILDVIYYNDELIGDCVKIKYTDNEYHFHSEELLNDFNIKFREYKLKKLLNELG